MSDVEYVTLIASLPALGPILAARHAPINRARLDQRLRLLRPEHRADLDAAAALIAWPRLLLTATDAEVVAAARRTIPALSSPVVAELVRDRLELRTVVAALRRRHAGADAPAPDAPWGYGRYLARIRAGWREPGFGIERAFPWVLAARDALEKGAVTALERIVLEAAWRQAARLSGDHAFDFEAVVIYVARWHILERWTRYDAEAAAARFAGLVDDALTAAGTLFADDPPLTEAAP